MSQSDLIIVGASARAAACSARRAGFRPWCVDLFADTDLAAIAPTVRLELNQYPAGLVDVVREKAPDAPLLYTGGLENYPEVYLALARLRPVWGYLHPDPLHGDSVRNPQFLQRLCAHHRVALPELRFDAGEVPRTGEWLVKPRAGSGGRGIAVWTGQDLDTTGHYFQLWVSGSSLSAVFLAHQGSTTLLGVTIQLIGESFLHTPGRFRYAGNINFALEDVDPDLTSQFVTLGTLLARGDPYLQGLFGIDAVLSGMTLCLIEVNPRYTASVEVIEHALGWPILADHARACGAGDGLPVSRPRVPDPELGVGKAIYYAPHDLVIEEPIDLGSVEDPWVLPPFADVPAVGTAIRAGQPVLTILTQEPDPGEALRRQAALLDERFRHSKS